MQDLHLTTDDMPLFTRLRMTAFGEAVIDIANDPTYDQWTFSQNIRHAHEQETAARTERRVLKLLKASRTPNPAACVEDIRYLDGRNLNRELVARLAACRWIDQTHNLVILGKSSVGKSYLAQALVNAACRRDYTARYFRLDDLANQLAVYHRQDAQRLTFLTGAAHLRSARARRLPHHPDHRGDRRRATEHPRRPRRTRVDGRDQPVRSRGLVPVATRRGHRGVHPEPHRQQRRTRPTRRAEHAPPHPR